MPCLQALAAARVDGPSGGGAMVVVTDMAWPGEGEGRRLVE